VNSWILLKFWIEKQATLFEHVLVSQNRFPLLRDMLYQDVGLARHAAMRDLGKAFRGGGRAGDRLWIAVEKLD
jgi:hypothetical protein